MQIRLASKVLVLRFLCATSVFSVSLWCVLARNHQPQRLREHRGCTEKSAVRTFRAKLANPEKILFILAKIHSYRSALNGSMRIARLAGK
jgi:hypothetical protein